MRYHTQEHGYTSVLFLKDDLTFHDSQELGSVLYKAVQDTNGALIVDMGDVGAMDITITGQFVAAHREARSIRRELALANVNPLVLKTLIAGQVTNLVQIYDTTQSAVAEIEERAHGGVQRKFIPDIKCGHSDCVYFTFARYRGAITMACQYPFPEEITNEPTCRSYRMNWNQKKNHAETMEIPALATKKKSLYELRDQVSNQSEGEEAPEPPLTGARPAGASPRPAPAEPDNNAPAMDPFADDNFPSSHHQPVEPAPLKTAPAPAVAPTAPPPPVIPSPPIRLSPEEVIRQYIDGWNTGRFTQEYKALSKTNRMLSIDDYCQRRRNLQAQQMQTHGKITQQEISRFDKVSINGAHAQVETIRIDRTPSGDRYFAQSFDMALEEGEWKIKSSRDGEERKVSAAPPKGRTMKLNSFQGKEEELKKQKARD